MLKLTEKLVYITLSDKRLIEKDVSYQNFLVILFNCC